MANENRGEIQITLDGESLTLRPSFEALAEIEFLCDLGVQGIALRLVKQNLTVKLIAAIIYGGLMGTGKPKYSLEEIQKKIFKAGLYKVIPACVQFMAQAMQGDEENISDEEKKT